MEFRTSTEEGKSCTEQTYDVLFWDGPLGLELDEQFGLARAKEVIEGGQAAKGGVEANDLIVALDSDAVTFDEAWAVINSRPRPITVSFRRAESATVGSLPPPAAAPQPHPDAEVRGTISVEVHQDAVEGEDPTQMAGSANAEMYAGEAHI